VRGTEVDEVVVDLVDDSAVDLHLWIFVKILIIGISIRCRELRQSKTEWSTIQLKINITNAIEPAPLRCDCLLDPLRPQL
jgi:hypothetical protein